LIENRHVDELVLLSGFELETVLVEEAFLLLLETRLDKDFLQLTHNLVEFVVLSIVIAIVANLKVFIFPKQQILPYSSR